jgi:hypothetical protein
MPLCEIHSHAFISPPPLTTVAQSGGNLSETNKYDTPHPPPRESMRWQNWETQHLTICFLTLNMQLHL